MSGKGSRSYRFGTLQGENIAIGDKSHAGDDITVHGVAGAVGRGAHVAGSTVTADEQRIQSMLSELRQAVENTLPQIPADSAADVRGAVADLDSDDDRRRGGALERLRKAVATAGAAAMPIISLIDKIVTAMRR